MSRDWRHIGIAAWLVAHALVAGAADPVMPPPAAPQTVTAEGFNARLVEAVDPASLVLEITPPVHNWFAARLTGLSTTEDTCIGFMAPQSTGMTVPWNVKKLQGLKPVMTYADPADPAAYTCYVRDPQGCWVSTDPLVPDAQRTAGTEAVPTQEIIPAALAAQGLSADRNTWSPWGEMPPAEVLPDHNVLRIRQRFAREDAAVCLRVPYTYAYLQAFLTRLQAAALPGVHVDVLGETVGQRRLQVIRVEDPSPTLPPAERRTILITAREHATEQAGSWAAHGLLLSLLQQTPEAEALRANTTWLIIPIQDPDGSVAGTFDALTDLFHPAVGTQQEALAYARYFVDLVNGGTAIDLVVSLHNLEANEGEHILSPFVDARYREQVIDCNRQLFAGLAQQGFLTGKPDKPWEYGLQSFRLYGWIALNLGALDLAFEVNDRYPRAPLSLARLQQLGAKLGAGLAAWCRSDAGTQWHAHVQQQLAMRTLERARYFQRQGYAPEQRTSRDILVKAY